jgi:hypothetical protein
MIICGNAKFADQPSEHNSQLPIFRVPPWESERTPFDEAVDHFRAIVQERKRSRRES